MEDLISLTEKEVGEGSQLLWKTPSDALSLIKGCLNNLKGSPVDESESLYATEFIVHRDKNILKYYINLLENNICY